MKKRRKKKIFLDYASATPVDPRVFAVMKPFFKERYANPSTVYEDGVLIKQSIEGFRKNIAEILGGHSDEIIFTSSGTESCNIALRGIFQSAQKLIPRPHIITSAIEHPAVLETIKNLEQFGAKVSYLPVDKNGEISINDFKKELTKDTVLVSIEYANGEVGVIEPIREISKTIRQFKMSKKSLKKFPYFHTDASQAANFLSLKVSELGVDLMTLDASKIYGPKGSGVLYLKRGTDISPIIFGGGQEDGLRSGTENVAAIAGMSKALSLTLEKRKDENKRMTALRNFCIESIQKKFPNAILNGPSENRLPNNVNFCFPGINGEFAVIKLDSLGVQASSASSCRTLKENSSSYVVEALQNGNKKCGELSLRFTFGRKSKKSDVMALLDALGKFVSK
ncbi:MAG: cysteine desulfurase NifS [Candidatus Zambryskibacteria bacterium CG11_big_fil_rev_8_21_14_0_20_40_24]|uniref:Cysteine desulfurase NifS n=2 Tax=Candidatus Zambryskiibacteriota TaxID=1817925 RepID=A0A2H0K7E4_9BACT|nr:MAG: cysteine desulfurase NifS [Candidatus Zambryskibacteria bacterium CG11_big_fil_rev_8_21_14_0_20_40_24]